MSTAPQSWPDGYLHDVFISYPGTDVVESWVSKFFEPKLRGWLGVNLTKFSKNSERIFLSGRTLQPGNNWENELIERHKRSCYMIAIICPTYFESKWCKAEWENMKIRERLIKERFNLVTTLIFPIIFHKGPKLPEDVQATQVIDFTNYAHSEPKSFIESQKYPSFESDLRELADKLTARISESPPWDLWPFEPPGEDDPPLPPVTTPCF